MKKILCAALAVLMFFSLSACGGEGTSAPRGGSTTKTVEDVLDEMTAADSDLPQTTSQEQETATVPEGSSPTQAPTQEPAEPAASEGATPSQTAAVDVDLTALNSTMVYAEVYNMMVSPEDYLGKVVKMIGPFYPYINTEGTKYYPACVIQDATACCAQGLEFVLAGAEYPDGYPEIGTVITVVGTFETYEEDGGLYCHLINAEME